ncbi:group II intron reverse transcriptase/maturase [Acetivibrio saccincola]|jgi:group II intron reverse transcriptase/maturase|uniref:RNA-directed DNA polymerase n=1 Tax=Acetivibrio saccincola TaxID=1677857 RepID=A0A2K9EIK8_9FIRM|nr:group II intron reverse transcriptase/maturase [Acetivibrio saccincola]AUG56351.1 Group II intron-encoded protein LtrA [Acetivibrio saccincola]
MKITENTLICRKQNKDTIISCGNSVEHERRRNGQSDSRMIENDNINTNKPTERMLERILSSGNMNEAYQKVKRNKGAGGVDQMEMDELLEHLKTHREEILTSLLKGSYKPYPVKRVEIPKENGKTRKLGIPTLRDRVVQQAILQVLSPIYEKQFVETSYGFRPNRGCHDALKKCQEYANQGYWYVIDIDLEKFFDTVNQSMLMEILSRLIKDNRVLSLIQKFLNAGIMDRGMFIRSDVGVPQGGPISPLLANIMLNELDQKLEEWGYRFVRYADDLMIFTKSKRAGQRQFQRVSKFIEGKLKLKINKEKTSITRLNQIKYLGYGFYRIKGKCRFRVHPKSITKLKDKLRETTGRSNGMSIEGRKTKLNQIIRGWVRYFKLADMKAIMQSIDEWLRRRIRMITWKRWKKVRTKFENLRKLGVAKEKGMGMG